MKNLLYVVLFIFITTYVNGSSDVIISVSLCQNDTLIPDTSDLNNPFEKQRLYDPLNAISLISKRQKPYFDHFDWELVSYMDSNMQVRPLYPGILIYNTPHPYMGGWDSPLPALLEFYDSLSGRRINEFDIQKNHPYGNKIGKIPIYPELLMDWNSKENFSIEGRTREVIMYYASFITTSVNRFNGNITLTYLLFGIDQHESIAQVKCTILALDKRGNLICRQDKIDKPIFSALVTSEGKYVCYNYGGPWNESLEALYPETFVIFDCKKKRLVYKEVLSDQLTFGGSAGGEVDTNFIHMSYTNSIFNASNGQRFQELFIDIDKGLLYKGDRVGEYYKYWVKYDRNGVYIDDKGPTRLIPFSSYLKVTNIDSQH